MQTEAFPLTNLNQLKGLAFLIALAVCGSASAQTSDWRWSITPTYGVAMFRPT